MIRIPSIAAKRALFVRTPCRLFCASMDCIDRPKDPMLVDLSQWPGKYRIPLNNVIKNIAGNENMVKEVKEKYLDEKSWASYLLTARRSLVTAPTTMLSHPELSGLIERLSKIDTETSKTEAIEQAAEYLFPILSKGAEVSMVDSILTYKALCNTSDLRLPHEWYPVARLTKRKIIYHGGPTNSGKTYEALQRLQHADAEKGGGVYCGPLRLLALEVYESLNKRGVYTDLLTGQERSNIPFSSHIACTMEMVNVNKEYDVAVIDEIQMIADPARGHAWTRALLGLRAREIHVCGGLEALDVVKKMVEKTGDDFQLRNYERMSTLVIADESLRGDYAKVEKGDCIVAFSRAEIFAIKREIERLTPLKCAVIYGALPPETRSMQARLFNQEVGGYDVLVASDAIGMGLNLNIRRVIFHTVLKKGNSGGGGFYWVEPSNIKQIGGRAGRRSSQYQQGVVTTWQQAHLMYVKAVMKFDIPQIAAAGIFPSIDQVEHFSEQLEQLSGDENVDDASAGDSAVAAEIDDGSHINDNIASAPSDVAIAPSLPHEISVKMRESQLVEARTVKVQKANLSFIRLSSLVSKFVELSRVDGGQYFLSAHDEMMLVSNWLHSIPLSIADRFTFANAPANTRDVFVMNHLYTFAASYALKRPVAINIRLPRHAPRDTFDLGNLCTKHNVIDLYLWLSCRFPKYFVERNFCMSQKAHAIQLIEESIGDVNLKMKTCMIEDFKKLVNLMTEKSPDNLPPDEPLYSHVRETMVDYMQQHAAGLNQKVEAATGQPRDDEDQGEKTADAAATQKGDQFSSQFCYPHEEYENRELAKFGNISRAGGGRAGRGGRGGGEDSKTASSSKGNPVVKRRVFSAKDFTPVEEKPKKREFFSEAADQAVARANRRNAAINANSTPNPVKKTVFFSEKAAVRTGSFSDSSPRPAAKPSVAPTDNKPTTNPTPPSFARGLKTTPDTVTEYSSDSEKKKSRKRNRARRDRLKKDSVM